MAGVSDINHPVFIIIKILKGYWRVKKYFICQYKLLIIDTLFHRIKCRLPDRLLVVKEALHLVEIPFKDRFRNISQATGLEDPFGFAEGLSHQVQRHVVQGLEHKNHVK